jgi:hypothetical protein
MTNVKGKNVVGTSCEELSIPLRIFLERAGGLENGN